MAGKGETCNCKRVKHVTPTPNFFPGDKFIFNFNRPSTKNNLEEKEKEKRNKEKDKGFITYFLETQRIMREIISFCGADAYEDFSKFFDIEYNPPSDIENEIKNTTLLLEEDYLSLETRSYCNFYLLFLNDEKHKRWFQRNKFEKL
jgi:hypothetical protein